LAGGVEEQVPSTHLTANSLSRLHQPSGFGRPEATLEGGKK